MNIYPDSYSKIALALSGSQVAKEALVAEYGIGEDIPFNFFGWDGPCLSMIVGMERAEMRKPMEKRFESSCGAIQVMRSYFGCDALTFVAEGFHSIKPELTKRHNLAELYAAHDQNVKECISVTHVELLSDMTPSVTLASITYQYLAGKWVVWDDDVRGFTRNVEEILREAPFPAMMTAALRSSVENADLDEMHRVLELLGENGFNVQTFDNDGEDF